MSVDENVTLQVGPVVEAIAVGLAKGIASELGAEAVEEAFSDTEVSSYFDGTYRELSKIVGQKLQQNTIDLINGQITATQAWVRTEYLPEKARGGWTREELVQKLEQQNLALGTSIGLLVQPDYAQAALGVFLVAAGLQLALVQEQTIVDPRAATPDASTYQVTLGAKAQLDYNHVLDTMIAILSTRAKKVTIEKTFSSYPAPIGDRTRWSWKDTVTGEKGATKHADEGEALRDREAHVLEECGSLVDKLGEPVTTALQWLSVKLSYDAAPLYMCSMTSADGWFYDYSPPQSYIARTGINGWDVYGVFGWMAAASGPPTDADVPVYRLVSASDPRYVRIVFSEAAYEALKAQGSTGPGTGLLGYLWRDAAKVPVGSAVPVYALRTGGAGTDRTQLVRSQAEYQETLGKPGWRPGGGLIGYLCSQG